MAAARRFDVKKIAIIGAGPCGLSAAKYLLAQKAFDSIDVYEQQTEVGGVWNYTKEASPTRHVPQVSAFAAPDPPVRTSPRVLATPMYDVLHTNIPWPLMKYSDLDFPKDSLIFPSREAVQDYLVGYSKDIRHLIQFGQLVDDVRLRREGGRDQWDVEVRSTTDGSSQTSTYDAVVVASGHYSTIFIPDVKNIKEFNEAHPGIITHSKSYRSPDSFQNKKVVVVGNAASGLDIASQISRVSRKPLLLSVRTPSPPENLAWAGAEEVPVIEEFLVAERGVRFQGGRVERDIDAVLYATGYLFTFPFLKSLVPPLVSDGRRVHGLYKHLIHIEHPTLVFPGLPIKVVPFPVSESQAAVFSRVWADVLPLPDKSEMQKWEEEEAQRQGPSFHVWQKGCDAEYINETHAALVTSKTPGKEPPFWDDELLWQRKIYAEAKLRFEKEGRAAKSLEELGFHSRPSPRPATEQEIL
jgi:cation diffusion facilitator CzcD-associated flavoprotein CzcO